MNAAPAPRVTLVIAARNMQAFIGATIESLRRQRDIEWCAIVVDDGSTDGTADVVNGFGDSRIRVLPGPARGVSAARNLGTRHVKTPYLLYLDADDLLVEDALARLAGILDAHPEAIGAYGPHARIREDGASIDPIETDRSLPSGDIIEPLLAKNIIVNGGSLMLRLAAVRRIEGMRENLRFGEDWEFWCRLALLGPILALPKTVLLYRQRSRGANYSQRGSRFAPAAACIAAIRDNPDVAARLNPDRLRRLLRNFQIDAFWAGVRMEYNLGSRRRALSTALAGAFLYPDSLARPSLVLRFVRSFLRRVPGPSGAASRPAS